MPETFRALLLGCVVLGLLSGGALAAPGVSGADVVNLRAGPTDASNIRGSVRVLQTGEEGRVYGRPARAGGAEGLLPRDAASWNDGDAGFLQLSEGFDRLIRRVNGDLGDAWWKARRR